MKFNGNFKSVYFLSTQPPWHGIPPHANGKLKPSLNHLGIA